MNHVYRLVWNHRLSAYVPAAEFARGRGKKPSRLRALSAAVLASVAVTAHALPGGGQVTAGQGSIAKSGGAMTVTQQTPKLAIDWLSFGIGANEAVRFNQPSASSIALNRVLGQDPSQILGSLSANGQVFLLNPNGVLFAQGAQLNVGGIIASTLGLSNSDFMSGRYTFAKGASAGSVVNQGTLSAADGGYVALLGPQVRNEGVITAKLGTAALAAGNQVTVNLNGNSLVSLAVDQGALDALAQNSQLIQADGGTAIMTAKAADRLLAAMVNNEGVIEARTLANQGGKIKLLADMDAGIVKVSGTLDASAPNGGDGGFIETSGAQVRVADGARITTAAAQGRTGLWLIDPADYTIAASGGDITGWALGSNLNSSNVTILSSQGTVNTNGNGDINVNDFVGWNANTNLNLSAKRDVNVNTGLNFAGNAAGLNLISGRDVNIRDAFVNGSGNINVQSSGGLVVAATAGGAGLNTNGRIDIAAGSGVAVDAGTAPGAFAQIRSGSGQTIIAKSISVTARGGNTAEIQNSMNGDQVIKIDGAGTGAGIDVINNGTVSGWATLSNFANGGEQDIKLTNADHIKVLGMAGPAQLTANGNQTISVTGGLSNSIQLGDPNAVGTSNISVTNNGATTQSVSAGGTISLSGGSAANGSWVQINSGGAGQTISALGIVLKGGSGGQNNNANIGGNNQSITVGSGGIHISGGSGPGTSNNSASIGQGDASGTQTITVNNNGGAFLTGGDGTGNHAQISSNGSGLQSIAANWVVLQGGANGDNNVANIGGNNQSVTAGSGGIQIYAGAAGSGNNSSIYQNGPDGSQTIVAGSGGIRITGGAGGSNNTASIGQNHSTGSQTVAVASGDILITGGGGTNNWAQIYKDGSSVSGPQSITANGIILQGGASGSNNVANINVNSGSGGQSLTTGSGGVHITGGAGGFNNTAGIVQGDPSGTQTITVAGGDISVLGGAAGNWAQLGNNGTSQNITLTDNAHLDLIAAGGSANINSQGNQTISLTGTGANAIQVGGASSADWAGIGANGAQSITAGTGTQSGSITLQGGTVAGRSVNIGNSGGGATTQMISTSGGISLTGGSASATGGTIPCGDEGVCATIHNNGIGVQSIVAKGIVLQGGPSGDNNHVYITGNSQSFTVGSDGIQITGGAEGTNNSVMINQNVPSATQTITVSGSVSLTGGGGENNRAEIWHSGNGSQSITANGIVLQAGSSGSNNGASIGGSSQSQTIVAGSGGIQIAGGVGGFDNNALIEQSGTLGTQTVTVSGGNVSLVGGGGTNNFAQLWNPGGGLQSITANGIMLQGGAGGVNNSASISHSGQSGGQRVNVYGGGLIHLQGGSGSGTADPSFWCPIGCSSNSASINNSGADGQSISFIGAPGSIEIYGGSNGSNNSANINNGAGTQVIGSDGYRASIVVQGGPSGGAYVDQSKQLGNTAYIWSNAAQTIYGTNVTVAGGSGGIDNFAKIGVGITNAGNSQSLTASGNVDVKAGAGGVANVFVSGGGTQTITAAGALTLTGAPGSTAFYGGVANISAGDPFNPVTQTITAGSISLNGSATGSNGQASIFAGAGVQTIEAGGIELNGGMGGGGPGAGNTAQISSGGNQNINVGSDGIQVRGGVGGIDNTASINQNDFAGTQTISLTNSDRLIVAAAAGSATINSQGNQTISLTGSGSNAVQVGDASSSQFSGITAGWTQTVIAGDAGESGSITITGGSSDGSGSFISNSSHGQNVATAGTITIVGGSAPSTGAGSGIATSGKGEQSITAKGLILVGGESGANNMAQIAVWRSDNFGQSITVGSDGISLSGGGGAGGNNSASVWNASTTGTQSITVTGGNVMLLGGSRNATNNASINSNAAQSIVLTDSDNLDIIAAGGSANIGAQGAQTITIAGAGANAIQLGDVSSLESSGIWANGSQFITAGTGLQSGSITLVGGTVTGKGVNIGTAFGSTTQSVSTTGTISLVGGSAGGSGQYWCQNVGLCVSINHAGGGLQSIAANGIIIQGGASGNNNSANINNNFGGAGQTVTVGSGGIQITGGGGTNNNASIDGNGGNQSINASHITINGGAGAGQFNIAGIHQNDSSAEQTITVTGPGGIVLNGGSVGADNQAEISSAGPSQTISATGTGGVSLNGGTSGSMNYAIISAGNASAHQTVTAGSGGIALRGGSGAGDSNWAFIFDNFNGSAAGGAIQNITVNDGGALTLTGGNSTGGGSGVAITVAGVTQTIAVNGGNLTMTGGSSGTGNTVNMQNQGALADDSAVAQNVTAGSITLTAGAGSPNNSVNMLSGGAQNVTTSGMIAITGGADGTGNHAQINGSGEQQIDAGQIVIRGGAGSSYGNWAQISHGGFGNQTISIYDGGSVALLAGSGTGTTTDKPGLVPGACAPQDECLAQPVTSDWAHIYSAAGNQTINFLGAGTLALAGGSGGNRNEASLSNGGIGTQSVSGVGPLDITLTGGSSGGNDFTSTDGVHYLRNNASIFSPYGAQSISGSSLTMKGAANLADAGSGNTGFSIYGKGQTISIAGPISLEAGAGSSAAVAIVSLADQAITGTTLALTAGMDGSGNRAAIEANGNQQVSLSGALMLSGGGGTGPSAGYNNYAQIRQLGAGAFSQSVTALNGIAIAGGSGDGMNGGTGDCGASCAGLSSSNNAGIYNAGSLGQTVSAGGAGILLYGGTLGNRNNAFIQNKSAGLQQIFSGRLWLQGGDSGGMDSRTLLSPTQSVFGSSYLTNNATITSGFYGLAGTQLINASTGAIALKGNSGSGSGMAGATITSVGTQTVFGGTIDLTGAGASPASIKSSNGNIDVVAGTSFSNHAGAGALSAPGGRWLLWAPAPSAVYSGGLVHDFVQYNASFSPTPTTPLASGNGLMYAVAPSLTPSFAAAVTKVYDGTTAVSGTTSLSATGAINGDAATVAAGSILYADKNAGSNKTVTASALSVSASDVAGKPVYGYLLPSTVSTATGEITPAILTLVGVRAYDGTVIFLPSAFGAAGTIAGVAGETLKLTGQGTVPSPNASTTPQPLSKGTLALTDGSGLASNYAIAASGNTGRITTDVPTSTASCKNGGWQFLSMIDGGATFRNQGQCIQFVYTGK